jgi:cytoskeletal protein CcmA (bactofilin family)
VWNKQRDELGAALQPELSRDNASQPVAPRSPAPAQTSGAAPAPTAAIGPSMYIKGEIRLRAELLVDGDVEGRLESESLLTVGPNGKVRANIKAREVVIFGSVRGDVEVTQKIAIRGQGSLIGNFKTCGISIDDGAYFKGSVDILRSDPVVRTEPAPVAQPKPEAQIAAR